MLFFASDDVSNVEGAEIFADGLYDVGYHCVAFTPGVTTFYLQFRNLGSDPFVRFFQRAAIPFQFIGHFLRIDQEVVRR